jgi:Tol biopolymer transport system component
MSDAHLTDYAAPPEPPVPERRFSPWVIILVGTAAAMLLFAAFAALMVDRDEGAPSRFGLASVTMPDGTLLVLEEVTFGRRHQFDVELPPKPGFSLFPKLNTRKLDSYSSNESNVVWLSRRDAATGRYLDLDWWSHSLAIDQHGDEVRDDDPRLMVMTESGSSSHGGPRPLSAARTGGGGGPIVCIVATSSVRAFRHEGDTFKLRVYNVAGEQVAVFDVPDRNPAVGTWPVWTPEPLPAEKSDGDVTLRLTGITGQGQIWTMGDGREEEHVNLYFQTQVLQNGTSTEEWYPVQQWLSDALGNQSSPWDCRLSPREAAWKVTMRLLRKETAAFAAHETWTADPLDVPQRDTSELVNATQSVNGVDLEIIALGGPGSVSYDQIAAPNTNASYNGSVGSTGQSFRIDTNDMGTGRGPGRNTTKVVCEVPHVAVRPREMGPRHDVRLLARDDQAREVKASGPNVNAEVYFWFLEAPADAKTLELTFIVQEDRNVEFVVAPPVIQRTPKRLSEQQVLTQVAAVTSFPLLFTSMRSGNADLLLAQPGTDTLLNLTRDPGFDGGGAWSPDGTRIAFSSSRTGNYDLFVMDADGDHVRQVTSDPMIDTSPTWSPDGRRLCFRRDGANGQNWELFVVNDDGTGETNLTNHPAHDADPAWSPDGTRIAFVSMRTDGAWYLYVMNADGSDVQLISRQCTGGYVYPAWSPDGTRIAFTGYPEKRYEIFVCDASGGNEVQLTTLGGHNAFAAWSPDGKQLIFAHREDHFPWGRASLYVMDADGSNVRELIPSEAAFDGGRAAWKPQ